MPDSEPVSVERMEGRTFGFFPPVRNTARNEWRFVEATWSDVCVANVGSGELVWVSRNLLDRMADAGDSVLIVGLRREVELREGQLTVIRPSVVQMPLAVNDSPRTVRAPAVVVPIRLEPSERRRTGRKIGVALMLGLVGLSFVGDTIRSATWGRQNWGRPALPRIAPGETFSSLAARMGPPSEDRAFTSLDGFRYRVLAWPAKPKLRVVLMATGSEEEHYLGMVGPGGRVVQFVEVSGEDVPRLLRSAAQF